MSDIEKIKAAHAARRAARRRPPRAPASPSAAMSPPSSSPDNANGSSRDTSKGSNDNDTKQGTATTTNTTTTATSTGGDSGEAAGDAAEIAQLREELKRLNLEMKSLHRNHITNIKAISAQRDMFAEQLAREQQRAGNPSSKHGSKNQSSRVGSGSTTLSVADVEAQLRAARIRNSDLEAENTMLRDEVKQLNFRVQASKTLDAASNGYQQVVDDLVAVKLKCAQLMEEKEDLLRINKELTTTSNVLSDSNGDLEKSRAQWVMQCAEVEKKRTELEKLLKQKSLELEQIRSGRDEARSDLQELKL